MSDSVLESRSWFSYVANHWRPILVLSWKRQIKTQALLSWLLGDQLQPLPDTALLGGIVWVRRLGVPLIITLINSATTGR